MLKTFKRVSTLTFKFYFMKRNLIGFFALVLAVAVSSFTVLRTTNVYFRYDGVGSHNVRTNFTELSSETTKLGSNVLAWIRIADDNGTVTNGEFDTMFEELDTVSDDDNSLNDDIEKTITVGSYVYQLEKKS